MDNVDLTGRQKAICEYIDKNPYTIKESVVKTLTKEGKGSRKTILNDINELVEYGIIGIRKDKPNSQIHHLVINNDSLLLSVMSDLDGFSKSFFILIDETKERFDEISHKIISYNSEDYLDAHSDIVQAQISLQILFQHLIGIYILSALFIWPKKTNDKEMLSKLYSIVFKRIQETQIKLSEAFLLDDAGLQFARGDIINEIFVLKPNKLKKVFENLEYIGLSNQVEPVLDSLWKIGFNFVPSGILHIHEFRKDFQNERLKHFENIVKDWRNMLEK